MLERYLEIAIDKIDRRLGEGYAVNHPDLLGLCVVALVIDQSLEDANPRDELARLADIGDAIADDL